MFFNRCVLPLSSDSAQLMLMRLYNLLIKLIMVVQKQFYRQKININSTIVSCYFLCYFYKFHVVKVNVNLLPCKCF